MEYKHNEFLEKIKNVGDNFVYENYLLTATEKKLYIFDLDDTLYLRCTTDYTILHKYIKEIIRKLHKAGKILCIASHNTSVEYCLKELDIHHLFTYIIGEYPRNKGNMILEILEYTNINKDDAIFFDDLYKNIQAVSDLGVDSYHIKSNLGILEKFI
jgi:HAD superfamily phosphatase (TIGR01681 family)